MRTLALGMVCACYQLFMCSLLGNIGVHWVKLLTSA